MRRSNQAHGQSYRRGVTLVEMLVVVALLVLMMTILASIFQVATGAISTSRTIQELDNNLKFLDMTIRRDLEGVTAKMTPPNDPAQNRGYFEYGENAPADLQGEDTDDYLAMTVKAPEGQTFTGRVWIAQQAGGSTINNSIMPVTVTSQFAEVIYFLRNGNLYRRVLLVVPERKGTLAVAGSNNTGIFVPSMFNGLPASWMAVNDISARPATSVTTGAPNDFLPIPNDLGDLTNREKRFARQRSNDDYYDHRTNSNVGGTRDGISDDGNYDGIPDYWPTLTFSQVHIASTNSVGGLPNGFNGLMNEDPGSAPGAPGTAYGRVTASIDVFAFPFIFPGMYSQPEQTSVASGIGWLHALDSQTTAGVPLTAGSNFNHAPLEFGDSLPNYTYQSWFGFPTWRETASINWRDPIEGLATGVLYLGGGGTVLSPGYQPLGLQHFDQSVAPTLKNPNFLPALGTLSLPPLVPFGSDGAGYNVVNSTAFLPPANAWEDDLIMTGVRSFDVKAYDPNPAIYNAPGSSIFYSAGYYDLGYASTDYIRVSGGTNTILTAGTPIAIQDSNGNPQGFGHEGRMPPLFNDNRLDPQRPIIRDLNNNLIPNNVGDNTGIPGVTNPPATFAPQRLRRVWDSWSTDYTNAPSVDVNLRGSPLQSYPLDRPIYPSYPAPYPQPLRGIQIQIRVVDPKNERVKVLTIRQDFSDKLQ